MGAIRMTIPTVYCQVFNMLHDMETETIKQMEFQAIIDGLEPLQIQCRYVIELRERSGDINNKRPWRE